MQAMTAEWAEWITVNILRGVTQEKLIDTMISHQFDREIASEAVSLSAKTLPAVPATLATLAAQVPEGAYSYANACAYPGTVFHTTDREVSILMKLDQPRVILFGNVLSKEECEMLMALAAPRLAQSTTVKADGAGSQLHADRTSRGCFFKVDETAFVGTLDRRLCELMQVPWERGEGLQVVNYQTAQEYRPHHDYFVPGLASTAVNTQVGGQRVSTLIVYLNTVPAGGETIFPKQNLSIAPVQGNALYFSYCDEAGRIDESTLHGGAPVLSGEKWITTKWVRQRAYRC
jgi:prolyl 4-hydroxylase